MLAVDLFLKILTTSDIDGDYDDGLEQHRRCVIGQQESTLRFDESLFFRYFGITHKHIRHELRNGSSSKLIENRLKLI